MASGLIPSSLSSRLVKLAKNLLKIFKHNNAFLDVWIIWHSYVLVFQYYVATYIGFHYYKVVFQMIFKMSASTIVLNDIQDTKEQWYNSEDKNMATSKSQNKTVWIQYVSYNNN